MSAKASRLFEPDKRGRIKLAVTVALVVTFVCGSLSWIGALAGLTQQLSDTNYPTGPVDPRIAVLELPAGAGEWDRAEHAALIDGLVAGGAAVIAYDVVFDARRSGTEELVDAIGRASSSSVAVVLAAQVTFVGDEQTDIPRIVSMVAPTEELVEVAELAHVQVIASTVDGLVRTVPLIGASGEFDLLPALSYAGVLLLRGESLGGISYHPTERFVGRGERTIPTRDLRQLEVNWSWQWSTNPASLPSGLVVTPEQVLAGNAPVQGRLVFVGVASTLEDFYATPVNPTATPGLHVHANAANTMLTELFRSGPDKMATVGFAALFAALVALGGIFLRMTWVPILAVAMMFAWQARVDLAFQIGQTLDPFWPHMAILGSAVGVVGARYVRQRREREMVAGLFGQYVPQQVVDNLLSSGGIEDVTQGQRVEVTVLFADLRGFTAIAATLEPADVRALLEVYYDHSTRIIQEHGGTVMQFVGDEVFAVFGAPLPQDDHAQRAVDAARAMQAAHGAVNAELAERNIEIAWGIGLNTGEVVAAHVGSQVHKQYAVVGQAVNVGARLCSQAGPGEIVLSRWTREKLTAPVEAESLGSVVLKGVSRDPEPARLLG